MTVRVLTVRENLLGANDERARMNRELLNRHGILMLNVMASPGAGKTSLILTTIAGLKERARIAVIEGDIASSVDADKASALGVPAIQINTGGGCHLDANMVAKALDHLALDGPLDEIDLLFVENVGNLVCTAEFALGEHRKVVVLSVPEGDDKPYKYPVMFAEADVVVISKCDVLPYFDFDVKSFSEAVCGINPKVRIFPLSCKTGEGMDPWFTWLGEETESRPAEIPAETPR